MAGLVFVILFAWLSDHYQNKHMFIAIAGGIGALFFILTVAITNHYAQCMSTHLSSPQKTCLWSDVCVIIAFGMIFGGFVLAITWGPNVITAPAEKRAVSLAIINGVGNSSSIYGVFLWPAKDAPRYVPGFA